MWPFLLLLIRNNRVRLMLVAGLLCFAPLWRHIALVLAGGADKVNYARMDLRYDPLLIGCLLAFVRFDPALLAIIRKRIIQNPFVIAGALAVLWLDLTGRLPKAAHTFSYTLQGLCLALTISYFIDRPTGVVGRVLNWKPMVWIGTLSYSLYLWNQLFLKPYPEFNFWVRGFPQNLAASFLAAAFSFYVIEQPALSLRKRIGKKAPSVSSEPVAAP